MVGHACCHGEVARLARAGRGRGGRAGRSRPPADGPLERAPRRVRAVSRGRERGRHRVHVRVAARLAPRAALDERVVADAAASLAHVLRPKGHTVRLETEGPAVRLTNSPRRLSQVVNNLVLSASHHGVGDAPGEVLVRQRASATHVELEVIDRGRGMDERASRRVFDPFVSTARDKGGSELGMPTVHEIVTGSFHGTIEVDSAQGRGTRFVVRLPLAPVA